MNPAGGRAIFASPAMQMLYRGALLDEGELEDFLAAYPDPAVSRRFHALRPWHHWRMAAYCLYRSERGQAADDAGLELERAALSRQISLR